MEGGAPHIHGELPKLGIDVAEPTVSKYMVRPKTHPSQTWKTFLRNHCEAMASLDFFTVPTATFRILIVAIPQIGGLHHRYTRIAA